MDLVIIEAAGKRRAWENFLRGFGMQATVIATLGHVCRFPQGADPIGIGFGEAITDFGRQPDPERLAVLHRALEGLGTRDRIYVASDDDTEGDVIALDVVDIIAGFDPALISRCYRVRARAMSRVGISRALSLATPVRGHVPEIVDAALEGRTRAVTDRWIYAALSRRAGVPVGRIRSAVPGAVLLSNIRPDLVQGPVETGEIILQGRASDGRGSFIARIPIHGGSADRKVIRLAAIAQRFANRMIPGVVRPVASLSAAVAPRFGDVRPFSTGDALAHAARHYGVPPLKAMAGLQASYMAGMISYPRTECRTLDEESGMMVARLGASCSITGLSAGAAIYEDELARGPHPGLHPTFGDGAASIERLRKLVSRNWSAVFPEDGSGPLDNHIEVVGLMTALVARRAFEASRDMTLERGFWRPGNDSASSGLSAEDVDALEDLEWEREISRTMPWSRHLSTGMRKWTGAAILLDLLMTEELGRASTLASHVDTALRSGWIEFDDDPFALPRLTPSGRKVLAATPPALRDPATARTISIAIANRNDMNGESREESLDARLRRRVLSWVGVMPEPVRRDLVNALRVRRDGGRQGGRPAMAIEGDASPQAADLAMMSDERPAM